MHYLKLIEQYPIISDQITTSSLKVILRELEHVIRQNIEGDIVELGCYIGSTSLFIKRLLDFYPTNHQLFHVYDSFEGLPSKNNQDQSSIGSQFKAGELAVSKKQFKIAFHQAGLKPPIIHKTWFEDIKDQDFPSTISFAFLDGDFYQSILDSLKLVWPRLSLDGIITIDDYDREALPGVSRAVKDFFQNQPIKIRKEQGIAIISKGINS